MFTVKFFEDPLLFYEQAHRLWVEAETRNNLILGLASRLREDLHTFGEELPLMALVQAEHGGIAASAVMTPPFAMVVQSEPLNQAAIETLADALIASGWRLPGVNGVEDVSDCFARTWQQKTGQDARLIVRSRAYELRQVAEIDLPPGRMELAKESDAQLAADLQNAMVAEVILEPRKPVTSESALVSIRQKRTFFWVDGGEAVSIALANRPQITGICVSGVYTPPAQRRRGYARALVAEVSKEMLSRGYELVNLFTNLSNPTSNKIYQEVGYKPVCDYHQYRFE